MLGAPCYFPSALSEKRNLFIFIVMFLQSDCVATVEQNTLHYTADKRRFVPGSGHDLETTEVSCSRSRVQMRFLFPDLLF